MSFIIECSVGEIIDKVSILRIKLENAADPAQIQHIIREYNMLKRSLQKDDDILREHCDRMYEINKRIWDLENTIREKGGRSEFDDAFVACATAIYRTNDERYMFKRELNELYGSEICEEKIYGVGLGLGPVKKV